MCSEYSERRRNTSKLDENSEIKTYPNPVNNILYISNIESGANIVINDITGRKLLSFRSSENTIEININILAPGVYIVHSENGKSKKFIKQ